MPMRYKIRTDKLRLRGFRPPADAPERTDLPTNREFEVISWLTAFGVLIAVTLAAAYPAFDPAAALLGQFP